MSDPVGLALLRERCPHLTPDHSKTVKTCCDTAQLQTLDKGLTFAGNLLRRCPSCMNNLAKHICEFTCSPQQSSFMNVKSTAKNDSNSMYMIFHVQSSKILVLNIYLIFFIVAYITEIDIFLTKNYTEGIFNSCKRVFMPSTGVLALDFMCGVPSTQCTAQKWFDYMGNKTVPQVPFQINYVTDNIPQSYVPLNIPIKSCSEALDVSYFIFLIFLIFNH